MFDTALTANDLVFLAKGAGMTLLVTAISVFFGTMPQPATANATSRTHAFARGRGMLISA